MRPLNLICVCYCLALAACGPQERAESTSAETSSDTLTSESRADDQSGTPRLAETNWKLVSVYNEKPTPPLQGITVVHLIFGKDQTMFGFGGCNSVAGRYTVNENTLRLEPETTTEVFCDHGEEEELFLKMLRNTRHFELGGDSLFLLDQNKSVIGKFKSVSHLLLFH